MRNFCCRTSSSTSRTIEWLLTPMGLCTSAMPECQAVVMTKARPEPAPRLRVLRAAGSLAAVNLHHVLEQLDGLVLRPLERVASHDRPEAAAITDALDLL